MQSESRTARVRKFADKSSTASRCELTRSSSVDVAKDRMNSVAAAIFSAADEDCMIRSMPDGNVTLSDAIRQLARQGQKSEMPTVKETTSSVTGQKKEKTWMVCSILFG